MLALLLQLAAPDPVPRLAVAAEFTRIAAGCDDCLVIANIARTVDTREVVDLLAFQQGSAAKRVVIVTADAADPAARDALVAAARGLSGERFTLTIVFALVDGEAGRALLADTARAQGWTVLASLAATTDSLAAVRAALTDAERPAAPPAPPAVPRSDF